MALSVDAQEKIAKWMKNSKNFLIILGNPGLGKTMFCAALFEFAMKNFNSFRYYNERQLFKRLRDCISEDRGDYLIELKNLLDDDFIFLDDIGSEKLTEFRQDVIFEAIDLRYSSMKPTVITSNLDTSDFRTSYHPRFCSRLLASENTLIQIMNGYDHRKDS